MLAGGNVALLAVPSGVPVSSVEMHDLELASNTLSFFINHLYLSTPTQA